jgi:hypothetical protein
VAPASDYPIVLFADRTAFRAWLSAHHAPQAGLWLQIAKAASLLQSLTYAEALDVALCIGWIDGQKRTHDRESFLQKFTPRQKRSAWSKRNREHEVYAGRGARIRGRHRRTPDRGVDATSCGGARRGREEAIGAERQPTQSSGVECCKGHTPAASSDRR